MKSPQSGLGTGENTSHFALIFSLVCRQSGKFRVYRRVHIRCRVRVGVFCASRAAPGSDQRTGQKLHPRTHYTLSQAVMYAMVGDGEPLTVVTLSDIHKMVYGQ